MKGFKIKLFKIYYNNYYYECNYKCESRIYRNIIILESQRVKEFGLNNNYNDCFLTLDNYKKLKGNELIINELGILNKNGLIELDYKIINGVENE